MKQVLLNNQSKLRKFKNKERPPMVEKMMNEHLQISKTKLKNILNNKNR